MKKILILLFTLLTFVSFSQNLERERKLANNFQYDAIVLFGGSILMPGIFFLNKNLDNPKTSESSRIIIGLSIGMHVSAFPLLGKSIYHRKRYNFLKKSIDNKMVP